VYVHKNNAGLFFWTVTGCEQRAHVW